MSFVDQVIEVKLEVRKRSTLPREVVAWCLLSATVWIVFGQTARFEFLNTDDPEYVLINEHVNSGLSVDNLLWSLTHARASNWHPLTWWSHMLDCQFFGLRPTGHHLVNVALHAASACLLFSVLWRMTCRAPLRPEISSALHLDASYYCSLITAGIFALHPLRAESVAWVSERKDVLSGLFFMLLLWAYGWYVQRASLRRYALVMIVFALGLMSKPALVIAPVLLWYLDCWPLGRWHRENGSTAWLAGAFRCALEKAPLLLLSLASGLITIWAQGEGHSFQNLEVLPLAARFDNALLSYTLYLDKTFWPSRLAMPYPHPYFVDELTRPRVALAAAFEIAITVVAFVQRKRRPWLWVGWAWYLTALLPMIGLVQVGDQAFADRYTYLAQIGISIMVCWTVAGLVEFLPLSAKGAVVVGFLAMTAAGVATWRQTGFWRDHEMLMRHALAVTDRNYIAYSSLGSFDVLHGRLGRACDEFEEALRDNPQSTNTRKKLAATSAQLGFALEAEGKRTDAARHYRRALEVFVDDSQLDWQRVSNNLAWLLATRADVPQAWPTEAVDRATSVCEATDFKNPSYLDTLAASYAAAGRYREAAQAVFNAAMIADQGGDHDAAILLRGRLDDYLANRPHREP